MQLVCQIQPDSRLQFRNSKRNISKGSFTSIDLFAGCGGMSLGLENAGFDIVHANEINKDAAKTYRANFPDIKLYEGDIRSINVLQLKKELDECPIDLIVAGPPCQGFSVAGKRDPADPRNLMFHYAIKYVKIFRPKIVVIENVVGMALAQEGKIIDNIKKSLSNLGYFPYSRILSASEYGVPQRRNRIFIIASRLRIPESKLFPSIQRKNVSVDEAISDLEYLDVNQTSTSYQLPAKTKYQSLMRRHSSSLYNHRSPNHSKKIQRRFASIPIGKNGRNVLKKSGTSKHTYLKFDPHELSNTLTTLPEDYIHYKKNRIPTVREMARLQSFPDDFIFLGPRTTGGTRRRNECPQYTQVGNAVPPLMAEAVFKNLVSVLRKYYW